LDRTTKLGKGAISFRPSKLAAVQAKASAVGLITGDLGRTYWGVRMGLVLKQEAKNPMMSYFIG
jgi:hypothetical protein